MVEPVAVEHCTCTGTREVEEIPTVGGGVETRCLHCGWRVRPPIRPGTLGVPLDLRREPTQKDFDNPCFEVIWELIKRVDVDFRDGTFSGASGNDVCAVLDALDRAKEGR